MDFRSLQNLPADQLADELMKAYPNVNPAAFAAAPVQTPQTDAADGLPAPGEKFMGPQGALGGPAAPPTDPFAMLGAVGGMMTPPQRPQLPMMRPGGGGAPANPGSYPAAGPARRRSQSLGEILGGLK